MPNHVINKVKFSGNEIEIRKMLDEIKNDEIGIGSIDFNKIVPMPESLNIESGSRTDMGYRKYAAYMNAKNLNEDVSKYLEYSSEHPESWNLGKTAYENKEKYGHQTWYEWCVDNWGTKWNAYDQYVDINGANTVIYFNTAWACPYEIFIALSKLYPKIKIWVKYADEDIGSNCGKFECKGGAMENLVEYEYSKTSINFAKHLWRE